VAYGAARCDRYSDCEFQQVNWHNQKTLLLTNSKCADNSSIIRIERLLIISIFDYSPIIVSYSITVNSPIIVGSPIIVSSRIIINNI